MLSTMFMRFDETFFQFLRRYLLNFKSKFILRSLGNIKFNNESRYRSLDENNLIRLGIFYGAIDRKVSTGMSFPRMEWLSFIGETAVNLLESMSEDCRDKFAEKRSFMVILFWDSKCFSRFKRNKKFLVQFNVQKFVIFLFT